MSIYLWSGLASSSSLVEPVVKLAMDGSVKDAVALAQGLMESQRGAVADEGMADLAALCADLMLVQDRDEEAADTYHFAIRAAANAPRGRVRMMSCRATGMTSLYRQRFGTAAECFRRLAQDGAASPAQRAEALAALALACHGMGQVGAAMRTLDEAAEVAGEAPAGASEDLFTLVSLLRTELSVRQEVRDHPALRDHVFWQGMQAAGTSRPRSMDALSSIDLCLRAHGGKRMVAQRLQHWRAMLMTLCGDAAAARTLHEHLGWLRQACLPAVERQERLETTLVALSMREVEMARHLLEPLVRPGEATRDRWNVEAAYCMAKVCELTGRNEESLRHYQRYALESVQCLRAEVPADVAKPERSAVKDGLEMSLPAKYRRAYRYLIEHLDSASLSIREIAEHINVTERALQSAFRQHLGMTPAEVLRRCRVERIRGELLKSESGAQTVLEAASRWGIRNRSTLAATYRKYFAETPAETLSRRGEPALA